MSHTPYFNNKDSHNNNKKKRKEIPNQTIRIRIGNQ